MFQEDAGLALINSDSLQNGSERALRSRVPIVDPDDLEAVNFNLFVLENPYPRALDSPEKARRVGKLFMISSHKESAVRRGKRGKWLNEDVRFHGYAVKEITPNKDNVRVQAVNEVGNVPGKSGASHMA